MTMKTLRLLVLMAFASMIAQPTVWSASPEEAVNALIPRLAASNVPDRYAAQMELQQLAAIASQPDAGAARSEMGKVLAAKAADASVPQPARVWIVRQLEYMGGAEAVSALSQLLNDKDAELRECARRALEKNPSSEAGASLRAALQKGGDPSWTIGIISALGQRKDAEAVRGIVPFLDQTQTLEASALALGRIGTSSAVDALWRVLDRNAAVADALVIAANQFAADKKNRQAKAIYQKLYQQSSLRASLRAAALNGLAKTDASAAAPLILEALGGTDACLQNAAVSVAPEALGRNYSKTLADRMPRLSPRVKALVLNILDASAEATVVEASGDADGDVRLAAIGAMGRMGGARSIPTLLKLADSSVRAEKNAAQDALLQIHGAGAGSAIEQAAAGGEGKTRAIAIKTLASRQQASAVPVLLRCAKDTDEAVRQSAFGALGRLAGEADLADLLKLATQDQAAEAFDAIEAVAQRTQNKPAAARKLLAIAVDESTQAALIDALSALGGPEALGVVTKFTSSTDATRRESAVKALGNWPDTSAAKPLLALAENPSLPDSLHRQALQAIVQLVKSSENASAESLADTALAALRATRQDEEKKIVISSFGFVPHPKAIETLKPLLTDPKYKTEAGQAGVALAELMFRTDKTAAKGLAQAVKDAEISTEITRRANRILGRP